MMDNIQREFKEVDHRYFSRLLNPRSTLLVTCCDSFGTPNVLSVAWHSPLSMDPPLVGISIAPKRYSHALIASTGEYVINIVGQEMQKAVDYCGSVSGRDVDKIAQANLLVQPAKMVHPPILSEAYGYLECQVEQVIPVGDHTWFVGRILNAAARSDCFSDAWNTDRAQVLLYLKLDQYGYFCSME